MIGAIFGVLRQPKYLAIAAASAAGIAFLYVWLRKMFDIGFLGLHAMEAPALFDLAVLVVFSVLFGVFVSLSAFASGIKKCPPKAHGIGALGGIAGILTAACPACVPLFFFAFGLSGVYFFLLGIKPWLALLSIALLLAGIFLTARSIGGKK